MTTEEFVTQRNQIIADAKRRIDDLHTELLASRRYPDGFVVRRSMPGSNTERVISGPIYDANVQYTVGYFEEVSASQVDILYHFRIENASDNLRHPRIGDTETVFESYLLNGTGEDGGVPQQLPPDTH